jgi:ribosomal protein L7/L12
MDEGQKIEAIKLYRERTGAGLEESKDAVGAIGRGQRFPSRRDDGDFRDEVLSLLEQGQKIGAIKLFRERTGAGLKESKEAVEALAERRGIVISQGTGCFGVVVAIGFLTGALVLAGDRPSTISEAKPSQDALLVHTVESPFQAGKTEIRSLIRDNPGSP